LRRNKVILTMSAVRQIVLSILLLLIVGGGWFAYQQGWFSPNRPNSALSSAPAGTAAVATNGAGGAGAPAAGSGERQRSAANGAARGAGRASFGGPPPVIAAPVEIDTAGMDVSTVGTVSATKAATIFPQVSGVVTDVSFVPGNPVTQGQALVKLDDADEQIAVQLAQVALDSARSTATRTEQLAKSNNATSVALEDAHTAVRKAEIDLKAAELALGKRTINAPFAGTIGLTSVNVGDLINSSTAVATLDDMSTVRVSFQVPERASGLVAVGQAISATTEALAGQSFTGRVTAVDSRVDATTRTLGVEASVPNTDGTLKPGMALTVGLQFPGEPHPSVASLAIQWDRQGSYVWKIDGNVVHRTPIQIITRRSGVVTVAGDLAEGDLVVTDGVLRLREGITVAVTSTAAPPVEGQPIPDAAASATPSRSKT
jgi:RND family efflux transporter MFP subunit